MFEFRWSRWKEIIGFKWSQLKLLWIGPLSALLGNLLVEILSLKELFPAYSAYAEEEMFSRGLACELVLYGLVTPFFEELLFRYILLGQLEAAAGRRAAVIISTAAFALYHVYVPQMVYAALLGSVFAWAFCRYGCLAAPWIIHGSANIFVCCVRALMVS